MNVPQKALLLIGSPRGEKSTSHSLGSYLLERLTENGVAQVETIHVYSALASPKKQTRMLDAIGAADLLIVASPLYVDGPPAAVTRVMELLCERRAEEMSAQGLVAIFNCGFPEASQNDTALRIMEHFAEAVGYRWLGGLGLGSGEAIAGAELEQRGGMVRNVTAALEQAAEALARGDAIPEEAVEQMARPLVPKWMYKMMAEVMWILRARKYRAVRKLGARPYKR